MVSGGGGPVRLRCHAAGAVASVVEGIVVTSMSGAEVPSSP